MTEAPRWRLNSSHYLKVAELPDGTRCEWEHKETSRETGRTVRKLYPVPILLNPGDPADCNYPGEIIVAHAVDGASNLSADIIFEGAPTPEMEPLNPTALAITDSMRHQWDHPIESLPSNGGMTSAESAFMQRMMEAFERVAPSPALAPSVTQAQYDELKAQVAALQAKPPERRV
jgi:hypothetical protein